MLKYILTFFLFMYLNNSTTIIDFNTKTNIENWRVVDDVVMGGKSSGSFKINNEGVGVFEGKVSLENNGGFSSVRCRFDKIKVDDYTTVSFKIKGDGKQYQFRIKANSRDYYSYIATFETSGDWEEIEIPLNKMYPSWRGRKLDMQNFSKNQIEEIAFLISNKKEEQFKLLIEKIELKK
jgi:NADH dehydrogenase [ubiquinone] 1 alpha subcomplex assembly factor 1